MARKRPDPIEEPPAASSSDEEEEEKREDSSEDEEEGSSSEEGSSGDEEDDVPVTQPPKKPETPAPATATAADDSDDESGSESESESDSDSPTPIVKPIATKPMEEASNAKKPRSKPLASPVKASAAKRPSESEGSKDNKRAKKKASEEGTPSTLSVEVKKPGEDAKKHLFQRLFTEDDEIAVLKGMLEYADKKGADPCVDMNAFHDFVKKYIHTDVTKAQLMDKIRRLRKKYENNVGKGKKGEDRTFNKPHEQKSFELSKKIWGKDGISGKVESSAVKSAAKSNGKATLKLELASPDKKTSDKKKVDVGEPMEVDKEGSKSGVCLFDKSYGVASLEGEVLKHGLEMIGGEKRAALEEKWKKIHIAELELFLQRSELITEQAKLLLELYKSEDK
ncbi:hypothetical protein COLO4_17402 [Corchorus olitorius]|uniref:Glabrous enhancer-binding protein-like DBD domain-containing protein n=1 Tax=Corchorus olitorius TaxID=93759 RepID=A0A1R3JCY3_9ROSI|nr:hypothetical protein COLO4_17402 [Corchorus olitorius]